MMRRQTRRAGYTMVELMVVIMIIVMLVSLLLGAVTKVMQLQARTEVMSDITQMAQALEAAKAGYNQNNPVDYFPSRLVLYNDISKYRDTTSMTATQAATAKHTAAVFRKMFGPRFISKGTTVTWPVPDGTVLSGAECLVFYLGGIPDPGATGVVRLTGFSIDPLDPTKLPTATQNKDRRGPFYQFRPNRLMSGPNGFYMYRDPYGTPYAYFGAYSANEYAPVSIYGTARQNTDNLHPSYKLTLTDAYHEGTLPKKCLCPNAFQIISAGKDKNLGRGGTLVTSSGSGEEETKDNLANFSQTELGNPVE